MLVIFDLDGTLVDSEPLSSQAFIDLLPDLGEPATALMRRYRGHRLADVFADLARRRGRPLPADFELHYRRRVAELYDSHLAPMPGALAMLQALKWPACVATNGPRAKMEHGLARAGLAGFFANRAYSAYDVGHWKPAPGLFLHAARVLGHEPQHCVVVEDSDAGLAAAHAAGMAAIHYCPDGEPARGEAQPLRHLGELPAVLEELAVACT